MNNFQKIIALILLISVPPSWAAGCFGRVFNPVTDMNWNNAFPVTIGGMRGKSGPNDPPLHSMPAVCNCSIKPGVGITFWEPRYVAEIARTAGCLSTMGGKETFGNSMAFLNSGDAATDVGSGGGSRMQVHWYRYPVAAMMDILESYAGCLSDSEFALGYTTEVDPDWNNDAFAVLSSAETLLFSNPIAALSCIPESVTAMFDYSIDTMFWCSGSQGTIYPLSGTSPTYANEAKGNLHVLAKFVARQFKSGGILSTIGPWAQCLSIYSPVWLKSQFRIDPIYPIHVNRTVVFGEPEMTFAIPGINTPTQTDSAYMIWQGRQCCAAPY